MPGTLSGAAARLLVAALTHQDESPTQLGQIAGISRKHTAREAARELVEAGYAELTPTTPRLLRPSDPFLASLASRVSARSVQGLTAPGHGEDGSSKERKKEIDSNTIYRRRAFVASEGSSTSPDDPGVEGPEVQKVYAPPEVQKVYPEVRKVYSTGTESVLEVQKVYSPGTKSVLEGRTGPEDGDEGKQARGVFEDSFAALLAADALPQSTQVFPPDAAYSRRHQAQMAALKAFWDETLPGKSVTDHSLSMLLRLGGGRGERVADLIVACSERGIERPVAYITAALKRMAQEDEAKHPREQSWELELAPMTPAFAAQLEETQRQAALLWPEE